MTARAPFGIALAAAGLVALSSVAGACGGPALQNAPRPNPAVVAGAAAATAAAITLADPDGAARNVDAEHELYRPIGPDPKPVKESAPADVLDRLDAAEHDERVHRPQPGGPGEPTAPTAAPQGPNGSPKAPSTAPTAPPSPFFPAPAARPAH